MHFTWVFVHKIWYSLSTQFWSEDLCLCPYYSVYTEREMLFPSHFTFVGTKVSLANFVTHPLCFHTAYKMTSHPSVLAWASDSKNPDLYYSGIELWELIQSWWDNSLRAPSGVGWLHYFIPWFIDRQSSIFFHILLKQLLVSYCEYGNFYRS